MSARPVWHVAWQRSGLLYVCLLLTSSSIRVQSESNHDYAVSELCRNHFLQQLHRVVDGATVFSSNERNLNCQLTFQTESILQRFMVRFDYLQLDCNDHLYIHDGAHVIDGKYKAELSCRNTQESVGTLYMRSNYITLEYKTDSWGTDNNGFQIVITAYKHIKMPGDCQDVVCGEHCISRDLACDEITHCPGGEDESASAGCAVGSLGTLMGMDRTLLLGAVAGLVLVLLVLLVSVLVCLCRRRSRQQHQPAANNGTHNSYQMTTLQYTGNGTHPAPTAGDKLLTSSENWTRPTEWTRSPRHAHCSPSLSTTHPLTVKRVDRETSGLCRGRSLRGVVCSTSLGQHTSTHTPDDAHGCYSTVLPTIVRVLHRISRAAFHI